MRISAKMVSAMVVAGMLCGCEVDGTNNLSSDSSAVGATPTPTTSPSPASTSTPAPSPSPTPTPEPTPTPTPTPTSNSVLNDGKTVFLTEGDSITAPHAPRTYAWDFGLAHPEVEFHDTAVGGSSLKDLISRRVSDMALHPDVMTVFIGANDFSSDDPQGYAQRLFDYVAPFRAMGTQVYVATILPQIHPTIATFSAQQWNTGRRQYAQIIKDALGKQIDGYIDFGGMAIMADDGAPYNTQLYSDGLHPTWRGTNGGIGGQDYLYDAYTKVMDPVVKQAVSRQ